MSGYAYDVGKRLRDLDKSIKALPNYHLVVTIEVIGDTQTKALSTESYLLRTSKSIQPLRLLMYRITPFIETLKHLVDAYKIGD